MRQIQQRDAHAIQYVCSRSEAKGKGEELSISTSFWNWGPRGVFNGFLGCLRNVLPVLEKEHAQEEACGTSAHWHKEKIIASSPSFYGDLLLRKEDFF